MSATLQFEGLELPVESGFLEVSSSGGMADLGLPLGVALAFAGAQSVHTTLIWWDDTSGHCGLYQKRSRSQWIRTRVTCLQIVALRPGPTAPGAVGLEVGFDSQEEQPVLRSPWFSPLTVAWFVERGPLWERVWAHPCRQIDYGRDR